MIKKVSNWVFGSFFRTMGRFFFFLFFGFLLATILSKSEIKITDLLGIETIKAVELSSDDMINQFTQDCSYRIDGGQTASTTSCGWYNNFRTATIDTSSSSGHGTVHFSSSNWSVPRYGLPTTNGYQYSLLPYQVQFQVRIDYTSIWSFNEIYIENNPDSGASYYSANQFDNGISFNFFPVFSDGESSTGAGGGLCSSNYSNNDGSYKYYTITCTVPSSAVSISDLRMMYYYNRTTTQSYQLSLDVGISTNFNFLYTGILEARQYLQDMQNNQSIIDIQTAQNETITILQDENTTQAESEANNFFESFTSQDNGGISSIITAPLSAISGLASATCSPITLPIPYLDNKQLVLPCMSAIYTEHFGSFFSLYQTIIFGVVAYRMLVSIFMMIQGFKNPDDDKIEVVDL